MLTDVFYASIFTSPIANKQGFSQIQSISRNATAFCVTSLLIKPMMLDPLVPGFVVPTRCFGENLAKHGAAVVAVIPLDG